MIAMGNSSAILSGVSATASSPEMSVLAAMGGVALVPVVLDGVLQGESRPVAMINMERTELAAPETLAEGEEIFADLSEEMIMVEHADDLADVVSLVTDADGMWARIVYAESGAVLDIHADDWETEFGTAAEMMILAAWDRAEVAALRALNGLVAA